MNLKFSHFKYLFLMIVLFVIVFTMFDKYNKDKFEIEKKREAEKEADKKNMEEKLIKFEHKKKEFEKEKEIFDEEKKNAEDEEKRKREIKREKQKKRMEIEEERKEIEKEEKEKRKIVREEEEKVYVLGYAKPLDFMACFSIASQLVNGYHPIIFSNSFENQQVPPNLENWLNETSKKIETFHDYCEENDHEKNKFFIFSDITDTSKNNFFQKSKKIKKIFIKILIKKKFILDQLSNFTKNSINFTINQTYILEQKKRNTLGHFMRSGLNVILTSSKLKKK